MSSHADLVEVRHSSLIRINVQPGGAICEKVTFDMHTSDLVADLRAEISVWWETKMTGRVTTNIENLNDESKLMCSFRIVKLKRIKLWCSALF